jgi:FSR family fosmidomycin resistance protein-like MFS transporter
VTSTRISRTLAEPAPAATRMDRRGIVALAGGHFVIDASVGAVPAMLAVWSAAFSLTDLAAAMVLGASLFVSSAIQPVFGVFADRKATSAFLWGGVLVATVGLAAAGLAGSYPLLLAAVIGSGLGVAAYHPEAARVTNQISAGRQETGLAWFMVGGNAGFAAGPLLVALMLPLLGGRSTLAFLVPGVVVTGWLLLERRRLSVPVVVADPTAPAGRSHVPGLSLILLITSLRTWTQFGLLAIVPLFLVDVRGASDDEAAIAVFAFTAAGAAGTIVGARLAEAVGGRLMLATSMPLTLPCVALFMLTEGALALTGLVLAGFVVMASFSVTVAIGQSYLPNRLALAAGLMIGFGAIGSAAPGLAIFGAIADSAGQEAALWAIAVVPVVAALLALWLPRPRKPDARPSP